MAGPLGLCGASSFIRSAARCEAGQPSCSTSGAPLPHRGRDVKGSFQFSRRHAGTAGAAVLLASVAPPALAGPMRIADICEASAPLWDRLEARQLNKPVFNRPPREQEYPDWLEGTWDATVTFEGYSFPSKSIDKRQIVADTTIPGFTKLSIIQVPDVGSGAQFKMRFRRRGGPGTPVTEDRAANLAAIVEGYLMRPGEVIESVDYNPDREPNRSTVFFRKGATNNAERIELFSNARESGLRESNGVFYALESIRQVTLGYSTQYGVPRIAIGDYLHVWSFKRMEDGLIRARISTAVYLQPNDSLIKYTSGPGGGAGPSSAPMPQLGNLLSISTEPVVFYSHTVMLKRAGD